MVSKNGLTIAVAGKGGSGKTTVSGLFITRLIQRDSARVLAVDADPSENLGFILGTPVDETLGKIRENTLEEIHNFPPGMTKAQYLEYRINQAVLESDKYDLLVMGRSEGPGCYCYVNRLLRTALDTLSRNYEYVVMDCEAGMEHVSRRTSREIDHLIVVTDPSMRGIDVASRVAGLADSLENRIGKKHLVLNRWTRDSETAFKDRIDQVHDEYGFSSRTILPETSDLARMDMEEKTIFQVSLSPVIAAAVENLLEKEILS